MTTKYSLAIGLFFSFSITVFSQSENQPELQTDTSSLSSVFGLSLEDLMNVKVVSASKKEESLFETPITSYIITYDEILKSGVTTIPEALKLVPALIVKEITPGSYDVSIRGAAQIPFQYTIVNTRTILVMIDYRSVFQSYDGGTIWNSLPVDLSDIDRIEVVEGPMASLYGANACSGIINIITKRSKNNLAVRAISQQGLPFMTQNSLSMSKMLNEKWSIDFSANYSQRNRSVNEFYDFAKKRYIPGDSLEAITPSGPYKMLESNFIDAYKNPELSAKKLGANAGLVYYLKNGSLSLKTGYSEGREFKATFTQTTMLINQGITNGYGQIQFQNDKTMAYVDYSSSFADYILGLKSFKFNSKSFNTYVHREFKLHEKFSLIPGLSAQSCVNDGEKYKYKNPNGIEIKSVNGNPVNNFSGTLRANYTPFSKLKLIGSIRIDQFTKTENLLPSYALIANYSLGQDNILRVSASQGFSGQFGNRVESTGITGGQYIAFANGVPTSAFVQQSIPAEKIKNQRYQNIEIGFRSKSLKKVTFDVATFYTHVSDLNQSTAINDTIRPASGAGTVTQIQRQLQFVNIPNASIDQFGIQINCNIEVIKGKMIARPYVYYQTSKYNNIPVAHFTDNFGISNLTGKIQPYTMSNTRMDFSNVMDPSSVFGLTIDYKITKKFSFYTNMYGYTEYYMFTKLNLPSNAEISVVDGQTSLLNLPTQPYTDRHNDSKVQSKVIVSAKLNYQINKYFSAFINARNLTNNMARENQFTDQIGGFYLLGASLDL